MGSQVRGESALAPGGAEIPQPRPHPSPGSYRSFRKRGVLGLVSRWPDHRAAPCIVLVPIQDRRTVGTRWERRPGEGTCGPHPEPTLAAPVPGLSPSHGSSSGWCCPPPTPKTQIGLVVFRKRQSCLYLSKGSADYAGPRGGLAAGRGFDAGKAAPARVRRKQTQGDDLPQLGLPPTLQTPSRLDTVRSPPLGAKAARGRRAWWLTWWQSLHVPVTWMPAHHTHASTWESLRQAEVPEARPGPRALSTGLSLQGTLRQSLLGELWSYMAISGNRSGGGRRLSTSPSPGPCPWYQEITPL